ncbi:DUF4293 domain-containing protein [Thermophagus xiamenensis]|uniref:DUF4293 domain-containing protein n=1 Tax=Thermophagus xiamenensis TaxID=385682 RepID=A0A1I1VQE5_9BACT|nr:DUF4293 domain-containing protein [Thermophagus xiamenensis]SFD85216.1 protein of unknown function [Thermophagus xiamenensis]
MIQRIQTLYLFFAALLTGSLFFFSLAEMANMQEYYELTWRGIFRIEQDASETLVIPGIALSILTIATTAVSFFTIFLFKKRILQIRLCGLNMGFLPGLSGLIYYMGKTGAKNLGVTDLSFNLPLILPLIALILVFLAMRAIGKDEALVRSIDRIR